MIFTFKGFHDANSHKWNNSCPNLTKMEQFSRPKLINKKKIQAHIAIIAIPPAPKAAAQNDFNISFTLPCNFTPMNSAAKRSTNAM